MSFFIFGFDDKLLTSTPDNFAQGTDQDTQGDIYTQYSTHQIYALWRHNFSDTSSIQFTPSYGVDVINLDIGGGLRVNQYQPTAEVRLEHFWTPSEHISLTSGLDFIGGGYEFTVDLPFSFENAANFDPLAERSYNWKEVDLDGDRMSMSMHKSTPYKMLIVGDWMSVLGIVLHD